mgnify:FL=1
MANPELPSGVDRYIRLTAAEYLLLEENIKHSRGQVSEAEFVSKHAPFLLRLGSLMIASEQESILSLKESEYWLSVLNTSSNQIKGNVPVGLNLLIKLYTALLEIESLANSESDHKFSDVREKLKEYQDASTNTSEANGGADHRAIEEATS